MSVIPAYDVTATYLSRAPKGAQLAGYTTGSGGIAWSAANWAANPGAVRIDQDSGAVDTTADVLDVERGAATPAECPGWAKKAIANFKNNARAGQRMPAIYCSASSVTAVVNALNAGGVHSGVCLWVANWNLSEPQAVADVLSAAGPFPVIAVQYTDKAKYYDTDVFSTTWLTHQSGVAGSLVAEGSSGPAVVALQQDLNAIGRPTVKVDGLFGPSTLAAVKGFQGLVHLVEDGVVGGQTWAAINAFKHVPPPPPPPHNPKPNAPLGVTAKTVHTLTVTREIKGYTGVYATKVTDHAGNVVTHHNTKETTFSVNVPSAGQYTVLTGADGYANTSHVVNVV